jgi:hypothetical protein
MYYFYGALECVKGSGHGLYLGTMLVYNAAKENHSSKTSNTQLSGSIAKPGSCRYKAEQTILFIVMPKGENSLYFIKGILKQCNFNTNGKKSCIKLSHTGEIPALIRLHD